MDCRNAGTGHSTAAASEARGAKQGLWGHSRPAPPIRAQASCTGQQWGHRPGESSRERAGQTDKQPAPAEGARAEGPNRQYRFHYRPNKAPSKPPHNRRQGPGSQAGGRGADRPAGPCLLCYRISWDRPKAEAKPGAEGRRTEPGCGCCTRKQAGRNQPSMAGAGGAEAKPERSPENDLLQLMIYCCSDPAPADGILPL